jgi:hypothetical protein
MTPINAFATQKNAAVAKIANGASWFTWIAGMSMINAIIAATGSQWHFFLGLGLTEVIDYIPSSGIGHVIAFGCDLVVASFWLLFGVQAKQGKKWPFIVGISFYVLDALLLVFGKEWLAVAFHAYALFRIFPGLLAVSDLRRIETAERQQSAMMAAQIGYAPAPGGVWPPPPVAPQPAWPPAANAQQAPAWPPAANAQQAPAWPPPANAQQAPEWPPQQAPAWQPPPADTLQAPVWTPPVEGSPPGGYPPVNR